jgi:hypothetical protein
VADRPVDGGAQPEVTGRVEGHPERRAVEDDLQRGQRPGRRLMGRVRVQHGPQPLAQGHRRRDVVRGQRRARRQQPVRRAPGRQGHGPGELFATGLRLGRVDEVPQEAGRAEIGHWRRNAVHDTTVAA